MIKKIYSIAIVLGIVFALVGCVDENEETVTTTMVETAESTTETMVETSVETTVETTEETTEIVAATSDYVEETEETAEAFEFIYNVRSHVLHSPTCNQLPKPENQQTLELTVEEAREYHCHQQCLW